MAKTKSKAELELENEKLTKELYSMKEMINSLVNSKKEENTIVLEKEKIEEEEYIEINPKKYIKVMSLYYGILNLSTLGMGQGKVYTFNKFGEIKNIIYEDLVSITNAQQSFTEKGYFYILDNKAVSALGLKDTYKKILTQEKIENITNMNIDEVRNLFNIMSEPQKETIYSIVVNKIIKGEPVDMNVLSVINQVTGIDLYQKAQESIRYSEILSGEKEE